MRKGRLLAMVIIFCGLVGIAMGITFIVEGISKDNYLKEAMREEQITIGLSQEQIESGDVVDTADEAQKAGDTVREHRHNIAPTYNDLLNGEQFDPTNSEDLIYAQALNLENYLYLAVAAFGLTTIATVSGVFMIVTGIAFGVAGLLLFSWNRNVSR